MKDDDIIYIRSKLEGVKAALGEAHYEKIKAALETDIIPKYKAAKVPATAYHGDANTGNVIIGPDQQLRVIDTGAMKYSVDVAGKGKGTGAADVARFLESLESKRPGLLTPAEVQALTELFNKSYFGKFGDGGLTAADMKAGITLYQVDLELALVRAVDPNAKAIADTTDIGPVARIDRLLGIPAEPIKSTMPTVPPYPLPPSADDNVRIR